MIDILRRFFDQSETSILSNVSKNDESGDIGIQPSKSLAKTITWSLLGTSVGAFSFLALELHLIMSLYFPTRLPFTKIITLLPYSQI